jgi:leukotriene A-4 hydrolase/aminopeptidase
MTTNDPNSFSDPTQGTIKHIDFQFQVDFSVKVIQATAIYTMETRISGALYLDTRDLVIDRIHAGDGDLAWELDKSDDKLGQRLHLRDLDSIDTFTIEYSTSPNATALQWVSPEQTTGGKHPFLYSQCQAIHARSIFPCQDTPAVRITYTAEMRVPKPLTAVMAAGMVDDETENDSTLFRFDMPQSIPAYLFALAVGNIESKDLGPRSRIYAEPESLEAAAWEFEGMEARIEAAERLFGPYPWERYDMLLLPPSFPYGGMENPRLTFLTPTLITGDRSLTSVVDHELAHSWTGNLVTNATWDDFWLNEGWTVYAERRITEVTEGVDKTQLDAVVGFNNMLEDMKLPDVTPEMTQLKTVKINPTRTTRVPYEKGFLFLTRIERVVGREKFDAFTAKYIHTYQFLSLTTEEFLEFLKVELPEAFEQVDIDTWIHSPGVPDDAPAFNSLLMKAVDTALERYQEDSTLPTPAEIGKLNVAQTRLFLQGLPESIATEDCKRLEKLLGIADSNNYEILTAFYLLSIRSGYQDVMPGVEEELRVVGRGLFIYPLYRNLAHADWGKQAAREFFERFKSGYHPIAVKRISDILAETGV